MADTDLAKRLVKIAEELTADGGDAKRQAGLKKVQGLAEELRKELLQLWRDEGSRDLSDDLAVLRNSLEEVRQLSSKLRKLG